MLFYYCIITRSTCAQYLTNLGGFGRVWERFMGVLISVVHVRCDQGCPPTHPYGKSVELITRDKRDTQGQERHPGTRETPKNKRDAYGIMHLMSIGVLLETEGLPGR